jgi:ABC-type transport system involved in multi-copper enzyme maturation permease subunit
MFRKEFASIWMPVLVRLGVALIIPTAAWIAKSEFNAFTAFLLLIGLFVAIAWTANTLGISAFNMERNDRAWEYFFTFPYSRLRLLAYKVGPRILALAGLLGLYFLAIAMTFPLTNGLQNREFLSPWVLSLLALVLFVSGLSLSLFDLKNIRILAGLPWFFLFLLMGEGLSRLFSELIPNRSSRLIANLVIAAFVLVTNVGLAFWVVFRRLDLQGEALHRRRYLAVALPPALFFIGISLWLILAR